MYFDERENEINAINLYNISVNNYRNDNSELYAPKEGLNKGNMFKEEYVPYKNYIYNIVVNGKRDELLLKIQELTFKSKDLNLYLDVNPSDINLYNEFKNTIEELNNYKDLYEKNYGPLCYNDTLYYDSYKWVMNPWPWENEGGKK